MRRWITFLTLLCSAGIAGCSEVALSGELKEWHKITLSCSGAATDEAATPNPFRDYRLDAVFTHPETGRVYKVPGYYAADGNAAETGASAGSVWQVHFSPDQTGTWHYSLSFRTGSGIALSTDPSAGVPAAAWDGTTGSFEVAASDKTGRDFRAHGRLQYVGKHHLRFAGTGRFFMKCGTDSPENLLAYEDFDDTPDAQRIAFTYWFHQHDPYRHPVVVHTRDNSEQDDYEPLLGDASKLTGVSLQPADSTTFSTVFNDTSRWVKNSADEAKPWVVACDEPGDSSTGLRDDGHSGAATNHLNARKNALWGNPMAGGAGVEWYFGGSSNEHSDITCEDFRSRAAFWPACRHMLAFWENRGVRYWEMGNDNAITSTTSDYCLANPGEQYVIYLKSGGTTNLNLYGSSGSFQVRWYDPRNGGELQTGTVATVAGGASVSLGAAPSAGSEDWVVLVEEAGGNAPPDFAGTSLSTAYGTPARPRPGAAR